VKKQIQLADPSAHVARILSFLPQAPQRHRSKELAAPSFIIDGLDVEKKSL